MTQPGGLIIGGTCCPAIQRWPGYMVEHAALLYRGGLIIQWNLCIVATPRQPVGCYTEVALLYSGTCV